MKLQMAEDQVVITNMGHSFSFKKGEPLEIPASAVQSCVTQGATPAVDQIQSQSEAETFRQIAGPERDKAIMDLMKQMVARNKRGDFTGAGKPDARILTEELKFIVTAKERDELWDEVRDGLSAGVDAEIEATEDLESDLEEDAETE